MRIALVLFTVLASLPPGLVAAQSVTQTTSPADTVKRLLPLAIAPPPVDTATSGGKTPSGEKTAEDKGAGEKAVPTSAPTRKDAIAALDAAIQMAKVFRGAERAGAVPGLEADTSHSFELGLRKDRVDAAVADRANEWTAALANARESIAGFLQAPLSCPVPAELSIPTMWRVTAERESVTSWAARLNEIYCELGGQLKVQRAAGITPGEESQEGETSSAAASFLPFAGLSAGHSTPQVSAQLADLYFTNRWRLYLRSTFQAKKADTVSEATTGTDDDAAAGTGLSAGQAAAKVDDKVRNAMLDPFGGDLNLTAGYYAKVPTPGLEGDANDEQHGLFLDARGGLKLIELPEQTLTLNEGRSSVTPFYTASVGVRLRLPTYLDRFVHNRAGAAELAAVLATTGIVDRSASALFSRNGDPAPLPQRVNVLHVSLGLDVNNTVQIGLSGNVWSNTGLKKRVAVEFNVVSAKTKEKDK
ncbi:MAG: hypothetical protein R2745_22540 [Vicinamibacterales bacterium]